VESLRLNVTYAHANIKNQILRFPCPPRPASMRQWRNAGTLTNKTLELSLNVR